MPAKSSNSSSRLFRPGKLLLLVILTLLLALLAIVWGQNPPPPAANQLAQHRNLGKAFYENPRTAAVYNLGGGRANGVSVLEAIARYEDIMGRTLVVEYVDQNRAGDHICYISDLRRLRADYPQWTVTRSLDTILLELAGHRRDAPR